MTVTILPRELGARLSCNYPGCDECLVTGQIQKAGIRVYAATQGWIRGLDPGSVKRLPNGRWDVCPVHAVEERAKQDARRQRGAEMRAKRDAIRALPLEAKAEARAELRRASRERARVKRAAKKEALKALIPAVAA